MFVRIVSDLDAVPSAAPSREPLMAATLALTSSGNISPISDLDAVPSAAPSREPLMAATLALIPGLERLLTLSQGRNFGYFGVGQVGRPSGAAALFRGGVPRGTPLGNRRRSSTSRVRTTWT